MHDLAVIGAGAAGFMAAITAAKLGKKVLLLDHSSRICEKIRISGGGRCNFTNINAGPENYSSQNPHFCKSALAQYTAQDFIELVESYGINYHEKKLGQLFCDEDSFQIINMLQMEASKYQVDFKQSVTVDSIEKLEQGFCLKYSKKEIEVGSVIIATGGLSIPQIGATDFGYKIAQQFDLKIVEPKPALVPFIFENRHPEEGSDVRIPSGLAGLALYSRVSNKRTSFDENILFTHKGLSGPAILQISSYWQEGESITIDLCPHLNLKEYLVEQKQINGSKILKSILKEIKYPENLHGFARTKINRANVFTADFIEVFPPLQNYLEKKIAELSKNDLDLIADALNAWTICPDDTEGFNKAEVTIGGVSTDELNSKTMESKKVPGLFFIGELVDVTGWLGGYNFQWAWSSGYVAGLNA